MVRMMFVFFATLGAMLVSACEPPPQLRVEGAIVQMSPVEGRPSAAYFTIYGGPQTVKLLAVTSPDTLRLEMHDSVEDEGMTMMQKIESVVVPVKGEVKFEAGGKHLMIWGVGGRAQKSGLLPMQFVFSNGDRIEIEAVIRQMGDAEPDDHQGDHEMPDDVKTEG